MVSKSHAVIAVSFEQHSTLKYEFKALKNQVNQKIDCRRVDVVMRQPKRNRKKDMIEKGHRMHGTIQSKCS